MRSFELLSYCPIKRYLILAETYHKLISQDCLDLSAVFADDLISQQLHVEARPSTDERIVEKQSVSRCFELNVVKLTSSVRTAVIIVLHFSHMKLTVSGTALLFFSACYTSPPPSLQQAFCGMPPLTSQAFGAERHAFCEELKVT